MSARILVADDHEVVRQGVRAILQSRPDWEICGEAVDGHDAVRLAQELHPDVIVMDITMPRMSGLEAA
jgi:DNA-binding NarL/FixJ family response regulator